MGLRQWIKKIERSADRELLVFKLEDGTTARFAPETYLEALSHEAKRGRERRLFGSTTKEEHPLAAALKRAADPQVRAEYSTILMLENL